MASNAVDITTGVTVVFGTTGIGGQITAIKPPGGTRGWEDTTHMGATIARTVIPHDLMEWGELEMMVHLNPDTDPGTGFAGVTGTYTETITITFFGPDDLAGATWVFTGFLTEYDPQEAELEGVMMARIKAKVVGDVAVTADA